MDIDNLEQYSRRANLKILRVKEEEGEDEESLIEVVVGLASACDVQIDPSKIITPYAHRSWDRKQVKGTDHCSFAFLKGGM